MTSPFRLWARSGAEQINGQHSTCQRRKLTESIYFLPGQADGGAEGLKTISML
jgi:hypothetical protein